MNAPDPPFQPEQWRAAIGMHADRYLPVFERIAARGGRWVPGWNWAAFFVSIIWLCYRRMPRLALGNLLLAPAVMGLLPMLLIAVAPEALVSLALPLSAVIYVVLAFVALPVYADALYFRTLRRRLHEGMTDATQAARLAPSWGSAIAGLILGLALPMGAVAMAVSAYSDFSARSKVADAMVAATDTRIAVNEFHEKNRRLPNREEGAGLAKPPTARQAKSIAWDATGRRIVITLADPLAGRQFALQADERDGAITWTCRNIDIPRRATLASCRD